jgi:hypothetical protein
MVRRTRFRAGALAVMLLAAWAVAVPRPDPAAARPHLPPEGRVFHGVASGTAIEDFTARSGRRPAVWQFWIQWGDTFQYAFARSSAARTRLMLHLSTAPGQNAGGRITPGEISRGGGDAYLLRLNAWLAEHGNPVYLRLMGEMNNCDLAYSSHNCDGSRRSADHAPRRFKQAWRRTYLIVRGGSVATINARLRAVGLPSVRGAGAELPRPRVAFMWSPMTGGSPMIRALRPQVFWPGARYVDWVATSFYSRFPTFHHLEPYYRSFAVRHRKPFAFGEWAMWGSDDPAFVRRLLAWVRGRDRVRMMIYNQGHDPAGPFRLRGFPRAQHEIRRGLASRRFAGVAPEFR